MYVHKEKNLFISAQTLALWKLKREFLSDNSVTWLAEFSPNGWMFSLGSFLKIIELAHIFPTIKVPH
jgi:hypothetical protein